VVDSAHNPGAAVKLQETLDELFPDQRIWLVFGVSEDKDIDGIFSALAERVEKIYCAKAPHPRAMEAEALAAKARSLGKPVEAIPDVGDALETALAEAPQGDLILVTGSIFVAASGRIAWFERIEPAQE
jgi:folylpolyglutamate synthase/dihydropteroate synthase